MVKQEKLWKEQDYCVINYETRIKIYKQYLTDYSKAR